MKSKPRWTAAATSGLCGRCQQLWQRLFGSGVRWDYGAAHPASPPCRSWTTPGGGCCGRIGAGECLSLLGDFWSALLGHMSLASLSKGRGKAEWEQLKHVRGGGEDGGHLLALPALIGRSRQRSSAQTSRDHDSSQKLFDLQCVTQETGTEGVPNDPETGCLLHLYAKSHSVSGGCSASPALFHCLPMQEGLSLLVPVPRGGREALWQEAGGASGAQL